MTLPNITEMSDFEITKGIAEIVYKKEFFRSSMKTTEAYTRGVGGMINQYVSYCNISDLWPLIVELRIIHVPYKDSLWEVYCYEYSDCIEPRYPDDEGLLRALAEVVYLVLYEKQEQDSE